MFYDTFYFLFCTELLLTVMMCSKSFIRFCNLVRIGPGLGVG